MVLRDPLTLAISAHSHALAKLEVRTIAGRGRLSGSANEEHHVARVNPAQFLSQVRTEAAKIVWPTRKETMMTGLMVVIMTSLLAFFFFGVDSAFSALVQWLLSLLG